MCSPPIAPGTGPRRPVLANPVGDGPPRFSVAGDGRLLVLRPMEQPPTHRLLAASQGDAVRCQPGRLPVPKPHQGSRSPHQLGQWYIQDPGDTQQREKGRVVLAGLDALEDVAADSGVEVEPLLGDPLSAAFGADALSEDAAALEEPGVVVGWVHSTNGRRKIILSQPDKTGIFATASPASRKRTFE